MPQQIAIDRGAQFLGDNDGGVVEVGNDVAYQRLGIANVVFVAVPAPNSQPWVLIDAGVIGTIRAILRGAENLFGNSTRPDAIVLTHGQFDHVGALTELAEEWNVPIYAHLLEQPYLNGSESYPPPDPSVGGGLMSTLSRFYPRGPIDVSRSLSVRPPDGSVSAMPGWQWIHTPGITPEHISLCRESDRTLIARDAFSTTAQESAYAVIRQDPELHGPPMYFTTDWESARASVVRLAKLEPEVVITGHGPPLHGPEMRQALHKLAAEFDAIAVPIEGKYVTRPPLSR